MTPIALDTLRAAFAGRLLTAPDEMAPFLTDWRGKWHGAAIAVAQPDSAADVAAVMAWCHEQQVPVVPQGGNTGLSGGATPDDSGRALVLSLARLNKVRRIDTQNNTMEVEAGVTLQQVQDAAAEAGRLFPLSLAAEGTCTIGGNLATNAGGVQVLRYGNARELCLGLEVATADGELWNGLRGLRKDNTGYDLRDLFIGSEGTLGVITAATLKLHPQPVATLTALAACPSLEACVALLMQARARLGAGLTGFEVMNRLSLALVARHFPQLAQPLPDAPWTVLLEQSDGESEAHARSLFEGLLEAAIEDGTVLDAVVAESLAQSRGLWHLRESIPLAQAAEGTNIKHDIALPVSAIPVFVEATDAALARAFPGAALVNFGHLGDGNLHYNLQAPPGMPAAEFLARHESAVNHIVYDGVMAHGGSISAEHGIGQLKRDELVQRKSPVALALMRSIKQALDPQGLLNPGRVIDVSAARAPAAGRSPGTSPRSAG